MGSSPSKKSQINNRVQNIKARYESRIAQNYQRIAETKAHKLTDSDKAYIARTKAEIAKLKAEMKVEIARAKL